jgi:hypothetical protein
LPPLEGGKVEALATCVMHVITEYRSERTSSVGDSQVGEDKEEDAECDGDSQVGDGDSLAGQVVDIVDQENNNLLLNL